jgi:hypothetical protein
MPKTVTLSSPAVLELLEAFRELLDECSRCSVSGHCVHRCVAGRLAKNLLPAGDALRWIRCEILKADARGSAV